jgi:CHAT domain-containing protein
VIAIVQEDQDQLRKYLLGQLSEEEEERVELRLLADADYSEEFGIVENELVDRYAEGSLSAEEREQFEAYFLRAPERREKLAFASALRRAARERVPAAAASRKSITRWSSFSSVYLKAAAVVIFVTALGLVVWLTLGRPDNEEGNAYLRAAYKNQRLTEARVTQLGYAPLVVTRGQEQAGVDELSLRRAELQLLKNLEERPGAEAHHALGRFYLAGREFDKAVEQLEAALELEPNNARAHADFGAALLEQAGLLRGGAGDGRGLEKLADSLDRLNRALDLDPSLLEARFNRALCLQQMRLPGQAREAWQEYLRHDPDSPWAEEARRNLRALPEQQAAVAPPQALEEYSDAYRRGEEERAWRVLSQTREMISGRMVPLQLTRKFLAAEAAGRREEAADALHLLGYAGRLEQERAGDSFVAELAGYYAAAGANQRLLLGRAQAEQAAGYSQCLNSRYKAALEHFTRARQLFAEAENVWEAKLAEYWIAYCYTQFDRVRESNAALSSLADYCQERGYRWLRSLALGWTANNHDLLSEHSKSIQYDRQALELAEAVSDTHHAQKLLTHLATQYSHVGRGGHALDYHRRALELAAARAAAPRQSWRNFAFASETLYALGKYGAAAAFEQEALGLSLNELKDPTLIHRSYTHLAAIYAELRSYPQAFRNAELSMQTAQALEDKAAGQRLVANSHRQLARILRRSGKCAEALPHYDRAVEMSQGKDNVLRRYETHKGRLLCLIAGPDDAAVEGELALVLELFEGNRANILEEQNRNSFFDNEQSVYDLAIDYAYGKGDHRRAFEYSETSRARSLLDSLRDNAHLSERGGEPDLVFTSVSRPLGLAEIQARLPERMQVVQYSVLKDRVLIWLLTRTQFAVVDQKISGEKVEADVREYVRLLLDRDETRRDEVRRKGAVLYEQLISPVAQRLSEGQQISLVPDKALFHLPFSALVSPKTGDYLITEFPLLFAPSANTLILCSEAAKKRPGASGEFLLSIGNPAFDRAAYSGLRDLPDAATEAREIARFYGAAAIYTGTDAAKETIRGQMARADVLHFAGHYVADDASPIRSKLLLAAGHQGAGGGDGALFSYEVLARKLKRPRLVVLSACQTGVEGYYGGEGSIGLSRTFLATGVPLVVASQWLVDSSATAELMIKFHEYRKLGGLTTVAALRRAQLDLLSGPSERFREPYYWAAFLAVGGHAEF